jgi:hypothetical protein
MRRVALPAKLRHDFDELLAGKRLGQLPGARRNVARRESQLRRHQNHPMSRGTQDIISVYFTDNSWPIEARHHDIKQDDVRLR